MVERYQIWRFESRNLVHIYKLGHCLTEERLTNITVVGLMLLDKFVWYMNASLEVTTLIFRFLLEIPAFAGCYHEIYQKGDARFSYRIGVLIMD